MVVDAHGPGRQPRPVFFICAARRPADGMSRAGPSAVGVLEQPGDDHGAGPIDGPAEHLAIPVPDLEAARACLIDSERAGEGQALGAMGRTLVPLFFGIDPGGRDPQVPGEPLDVLPVEDALVPDPQPGLGDVTAGDGVDDEVGLLAENPRDLAEREVVVLHRMTSLSYIVLASRFLRENIVVGRRTPGSDEFRRPRTRGGDGGRPRRSDGEVAGSRWRSCGSGASEGTTSSSDGQRFRAGGVGEARGEVNARYGNDPGVTFYTHVSDQYAPFHTKVINATIRDATHVLDGLLYHESDLRIEEHYTDTAGFTDHVFALCHLLGYRFAPRIRDLADKRFATIEKPNRYPALEGLIGATLNAKQITAHWDEILRLATSIQQGTVTASLMLRKLGAYPRQNGLALALRELGRLERTLFTLEYLKDMELRRRIHVGLNKGEARNALARAVFFNRLGELRDRTYENQRHRASGLNLVVASIVLWNTVYLERAVKALREQGQAVSDDLLPHLSPLGWEHINLTGDYVWRPGEREKHRPLRQLRLPLSQEAPQP